ncbi:MAG: DUF423 domain-containing protein [Reinekea sp.]
MTMNRFALISGSIMAALAVIIDAFGAHAIADMVTPPRLATWQIGDRYLMFHGLGLLLVGTLSIVLKQPLKWPTYLLFAGSCVFCATLFLLVLLDISWLGAITPIGGVLMIAGWSVLAVNLFFATRHQTP